MIVRALDGNDDWLFGKGKNDYLSKNDAIAQELKTRLRSFLGNCFFDIEAGVDWFNLLGAKNKAAISLSVSAVITNTPGVTGLVQLSTVLNSRRQLTLPYNVTTVYAGIIRSGIGLLLTDDGDILTTEDGDHIHG